MSVFYALRNEKDEVILARAKWCSGFWCKLRGLMFRRSLPESDGLIFVYERESVLETTIHMLFMAFPIAVIWLDAEQRVVDKALAKPWRLAYAPRRAAQYVIEAHPTLLERVQIGEKLVLSAQR
ncbi:MAG: DUF192 domain-containing protein [Anaerolineae bacterium]|nr:DUF192 domain-containing protein [Anaerolineae bacterium]MDW8300059.1 DUF192 domain-containing protein [Anaerolineae bacterium]